MHFLPFKKFIEYHLDGSKGQKYAQKVIFQVTDFKLPQIKLKMRCKICLHFFPICKLSNSKDSNLRSDDKFLSSQFCFY